MRRAIGAALRSPSSILVSHIVCVLLAVASAPLVARALGPVGRGVSSTVLAYVAVLPVLLGAGIPLVVRQLCAGDQSLSRQISRSARRASAVMVLAALVAAVAAGETVFAKLSGPDRVAMYVCVLICPLYVSVLVDQSILIARARYAAVAVLQGSGLATNTAILVGLWFADALSAASVILAYAASVVVWASMARLLVAIRDRRTPASRAGAEVSTVELFRRGRRFAFSQLLEAAHLRVEQIIAFALLGSSLAGVFAVAVTVASIPIGIGHTVSSVFFRRIIVVEVAARARTAGLAIRAALIIGLLLGGPAALAAPLVVPLIFGSEFVNSVPPTVVMMLTSPLACGAFVLVNLLGALDCSRQMVIGQLAGLLTMMLGSLWATTASSPTGFALASAAGSAVTLGFAMRFLGLRPAELRVTRSDLRMAYHTIVTGRAT